MKIYDMHIHAGSGTPNPEALLENFDKAGVYGGAIISIEPKESYDSVRMDYEERLENILNWTKGYEDRLFPVLWIHPREDNIRKKIKDAAGRGIAAFKMICDDYYVQDALSMNAINCIAETGKPIIFHSGILWSGTAPASIYNRPVNWEHLLNIPKMRFVLAHCSWPWNDEFYAVYGRMMGAYRKDPEGTPEMFGDLSPGTPAVYREDLFRKLHFGCYDMSHSIMFGTDLSASDYNFKAASELIDFDNKLYDKLGITEEKRKLVYEENFLRFIGKINQDFKNIPEWRLF